MKTFAILGQKGDYSEREVWIEFITSSEEAAQKQVEKLTSEYHRQSCISKYKSELTSKINRKVREEFPMPVSDWLSPPLMDKTKKNNPDYVKQYQRDKQKYFDDQKKFVQEKMNPWSELIYNTVRERMEKEYREEDVDFTIQDYDEPTFWYQEVENDL